MDRSLIRSLAVAGAVTIGLLGAGSAVFAASETAGPKVTLSGQAATLDVSRLGVNGVRYAWNFGDGSFELAGAVVSHSYTQPGDYTVSVDIVDENGNDTTVTLIVSFADVESRSIDTEGDPIEAPAAPVVNPLGAALVSE